MTMTEPTREELVEAVRAQLSQVYDPEIGFNVIELGLVYDIQVNDGVAEITMTLTTPFCPYGPALIEQCKLAVLDLPEITDVKINITFDPPWDPRIHASDEVKLLLGLTGVQGFLSGG
jgi:metal-sulfur cluster biosynthetic enzyme